MPKKIERVISPVFPFHPFLLEIARQNHRYYLEPVGSILKTFLPAELFVQSFPLTYHVPNPHILYEPEPTIIIGPQQERLLYYDKIIREAFAHNKSAVLFVPTVQLAEHLFRYYKDLPKEIILLHGGFTRHHMRKALMRIQKRISPSLIIGTPLALGILNGDENVVIIEDSESRHYMKQEHPRITTSDALCTFAKSIFAHAIKGKPFPSLEDISSGASLEYLNSRFDSSREQILIDMTMRNQEKFVILSDELREKMRSDEARAILFVSRRGFYSFVICADCGYLALCTFCSKPLTLHTNTARRFLCHPCKKEYETDTQCSNCKGWRLKGYGVGTERVAHDIKYVFPKRAAWILDEENAKTKKDRERIVAAFMSSENGILIGTEMILEEPILHANCAAAIAIDNLFSIPDFRMNERMLSLLFRLRERADTAFIIQTRFPKHPIFQYFISHGIRHLLEKELEERRKENLPPYSTLIRIAIRDKNHKKSQIRMEHLKKMLSRLLADIESYPIFEQKEGTLWAQYLLLMIEKNQWEKNSEHLKQALLAGSVEWDIAVNPLSIL